MSRLETKKVSNGRTHEQDFNSFYSSPKPEAGTEDAKVKNTLNYKTITKNANAEAKPIKASSMTPNLGKQSSKLCHAQEEHGSGFPSIQGGDRAPF